MRRRRRPTLHHVVKDKRVTVLGPVKQPEMDFMSHRGHRPLKGALGAAPRTSHRSNALMGGGGGATAPGAV